MFEKISKYSFKDLNRILIGNKVRFISDCQLFPDFDVTGKVLSISIAANNEYIIEISRTDSNKRYKIGSNMSNLKFSVI